MCECVNICVPVCVCESKGIGDHPQLLSASHLESGCLS